MRAANERCRCWGSEKPDVTPDFSSVMLWSPTSTRGDRTNEEAFFERADHRVSAEAEAGLAVKDLCRRHGFLEASYHLWKSKFGGVSVPHAKRLKQLEMENARLKKLLAETLLEAEVSREVQFAAIDSKSNCY